MKHTFGAKRQTKIEETLIVADADSQTGEWTLRNNKFTKLSKE